MSIISQLSKSLPKNIIISGEENTRPFECDGLSVYKQKPLAVVLPNEISQVKKVLEICRKNKTPVVTRGAGTGLSGGAMPIDKMNLAPTNRSRLEEMIKKPHGILLVVGPTGSGKTTTLHAILGYLNTPEKKIWTAEDPVEITQPGLQQVQVSPKIGFTFANALRAFLSLILALKPPEPKRTVLIFLVLGSLT